MPWACRPPGRRSPPPAAPGARRASVAAAFRQRPAACPAARPRSRRAGPGRVAARSAAAGRPRRDRPRARSAAASVSRLLAPRLVGRLGRLAAVAAAVALGELALHRGNALARPVAQRGVRALGGDGLIGGQGGPPFFLLLAREPQAGQRAEACASLHVGDAADGLERLGRLREALLLQ